MDFDRARELLASERARVERELVDLSPDARADEEEDHTDVAATAPELLEAEIDEGLSESLREQLAAIERAERRLAEGTYGLSVESGQPIPDARLQAVPWAERTVEEESRR